MITKGEAAMLLTTINAHHGNAQWDDLQLDEFYRELDKRNSIQDMRSAIVRFYASQPDKWMRAADINILCKKIRASRVPDENTIQQLAARHHVTADDYWEFKRRVIFGTAREAQELGEAVSKALEQADRPQITSKPIVRQPTVADDLGDLFKTPRANGRKPTSTASTKAKPPTGGTRGEGTRKPKSSRNSNPIRQRMWT